MSTGSGMSQRVMNMKFMRTAESSSARSQAEETENKLKDSSEWKLPANRTIQVQKPASRNFESVGYASLNALANDDDDEPKPVGRRTLGKPLSKTDAPDVKAEKDKLDEVLEDMWNKESPSNKRKQDGEDKLKKKKKKPSKK
ncbi:unnamed protein product [Kuraishia capsulata CBS 1993]|uniref:M-phase phosphoprotein 6 n=1 Tax=Kuraishia capsulata CBS 1993 TaxID=1382522 RepID=W6MWQ1_9ASCO|nr:uncharacterized protein KUCA_T00003714001 [Kuraishia capsulata CBS 1993]CDK27735.1 unnamed protein product [Kuraishia capsulata CBS 1993]